MTEENNYYSASIPKTSTQLFSQMDSDIEKQVAIDSTLNEKQVSTADSLSVENEDLNFVDWDGENDPEKPWNWIKRRKWVVISIGISRYMALLRS